MDARYFTNGTLTESRLYQITKDCFQMDPGQRSSMQEVVSALERLAEMVVVP
jgi:hypothetical protein